MSSKLPIQKLPKDQRIIAVLHGTSADHVALEVATVTRMFQDHHSWTAFSLSKSSLQTKWFVHYQYPWTHHIYQIQMMISAIFKTLAKMFIHFIWRTRQETVNCLATLGRSTSLRFHFTTVPGGGPEMTIGIRTCCVCLTSFHHTKNNQKHMIFL